MTNLLSIVITNYNRFPLVNQAIYSALKFVSKINGNVIVVDDASTDGSYQKIAAKFKLEIESKKLIVLRNKFNIGVTGSKNKGYLKAKAKWVGFLDSDDLVTTNWLEDFYTIINTNFNIDIVFCDGIKKYNNAEDVTIKSNYPYNSKVKDDGGLYLAGLFAIKKVWFERIGGFDEQLKFGEFTDLGFRIKEYKVITAFTQKIGMLYRITPEGGGKNLKNKIESNLYFIKKHQEYFSKTPHVYQLFLQNIAVSYFRLNDFNKGKKYLYKSYILRIWNFKIALRLVLSFIPFLYKKIVD